MNEKKFVYVPRIGVKQMYTMLGDTRATITHTKTSLVEVKLVVNPLDSNYQKKLDKISKTKKISKTSSLVETEWTLNGLILHHSDC